MLTASGSPSAAALFAPDSDVRVEVVRLIRAGQKIEAIKVYRDATKCGLKEAKDAVEAVERTLAKQH